MKDRIYLDYAASTPVDREVFNAATPYYTDVFYNPSSTHAMGQQASCAVERARKQCAAALGCLPSEIIFTSSGTEAINQALCRTVFSQGKKHVVVSAIEHDSTLECAKILERDGYDVEYVYPTSDGIITPPSLSAVLRRDTALVCVMTVNNQVGTIQPIAELSAISHDCGALFFSDGVQAVNSCDINVNKLGADMFALSGHKFYSTKGAGLLYVKTGVDVHPLVLGGGQEKARRAGTVDVPAVVAMGAAIERAVNYRELYVKHADAVCKKFLDTLEYGRAVSVGAPKAGDIVTVVFDGIDGGRLAVALSYSGVCCSVGSACSAGSATPPQTLVAMGENASCAVRFSFGKPTTEEQAAAAANIVNDVVARMKK